MHINFVFDNNFITKLFLKSSWLIKIFINGQIENNDEMVVECKMSY